VNPIAYNAFSERIVPLKMASFTSLCSISKAIEEDLLRVRLGPNLKIAKVCAPVRENNLRVKSKKYDEGKITCGI